MKFIIMQFSPQNQLRDSYLEIHNTFYYYNRVGLRKLLFLKLVHVKNST
jgi:hypothetical protein